MKRQGTKADMLKRLQQKVQQIDLGGGAFWKPQVGRSTIRIIPAVGTMEFFFKEVGQHYIGNTYYYCPTVCNDGDSKRFPCPICEVNEALYAAGEKEAAAQFRVGRRFYMNIIERPAPPAKDADRVQIFAAPQSVMQVIISLVGDPDYGDISDPGIGFDLKIDRTGEGKESKYATLPGAKPCALSTSEELLEALLSSAKDLNTYVGEKIMSYDDLAIKSGVSVYIDGYEDKVEDEEEVELEEEDEDDEVELEEEDEEAEVKPSQVLTSRLNARLAVKKPVRK